MRLLSEHAQAVVRYIQNTFNATLAHRADPICFSAPSLSSAVATLIVWL